MATQPSFAAFEELAKKMGIPEETTLRLLAALPVNKGPVVDPVGWKGKAQEPGAITEEEAKGVVIRAGTVEKNKKGHVVRVSYQMGSLPAEVEALVKVGQVVMGAGGQAKTREVISALAFFALTKDEDLSEEDRERRGWLRQGYRKVAKANPEVAKALSGLRLPGFPKAG